MESIVENQIDLFGEPLPTMDQIKKLSDFVHSSESNLLGFVEQLEEQLAGKSEKSLVAAGIGLFIVGRDAEAVDKLEKADDCKEKFFYLAFALRRMGEFEQAIANLDKSPGHGAETLAVTLEKAETYRCAGDFDAVSAELKSCANFKDVSAEYQYQLGRLQEAQGLYEQAMDNYKIALDLNPGHQKALFHLAYRCDLSGDEEAAVDYYKQIVSGCPVYVSALLNLAVLYEDVGKYDKAIRYVEKVLESHPNHQRATLFRKDIESSETMLYDEEKEKRQTRKSQILETPISDFELSVRSRNCLRKMKLITIGDLLQISEAELLAYKNFGETSLHEIKAILDPKGLRLGMALEQEQAAFTEDSVMSDGESVDESMLKKTVEDLQLSVRARTCLLRLNIRTISELIQRTEAELLGVKNFGVTSLNEIKKAINNLGLSLRRLD